MKTERIFRKEESAQVVYTDGYPGALVYFYHIDPETLKATPAGAMSVSEDGYADKLLGDGFEEVDVNTFRILYTET